MDESRDGLNARRAGGRVTTGVHRAGVWIVPVAAAATFLLCVAGLVARAKAGPVWPAVLTDWSLGSTLLSVSSVSVGAVLARKVPGNIVGWLFVALGPLTALVFALRWYTTLAIAGPEVPATALWSAWAFVWVIPVNMTMLTLLALLFPHGEALSRRWRVAVVIFTANGVVSTLATMVSPYIPDQTLFHRLPNPAELLTAATGGLIVELTTMVLLVGLLTSAAGLILRLRRDTGRERQQVKWFVFAVVVAFSTHLVGFWVRPIFVLATLVALPAVPVAAAIAVLRYRLYDIDRVINRTIVYALLTGVLALSYLGVVAGLRALLTPLTGNAAPPVAASTLAVAALFQPVRRRIQMAVDRRFNRARYDAQATVAGLRSRFREEVDLDTLKSDLVEVVYATMQPAGTTLWLREAER